VNAEPDAPARDAAEHAETVPGEPAGELVNGIDTLQPIAEVPYTEANPESQEPSGSEAVQTPPEAPVSTTTNKDKKIQELQCLVQLQTQQTDLLKQALTQCY